jgi:hypothetical protein
VRHTIPVTRSIPLRNAIRLPPLRFPKSCRSMAAIFSGSHVASNLLELIEASRRKSHRY